MTDTHSGMSSFRGLTRGFLLLRILSVATSVTPHTKHIRNKGRNKGVGLSIAK